MFRRNIGYMIKVRRFSVIIVCQNITNITSLCYRVIKCCDDLFSIALVKVSKPIGILSRKTNYKLYKKIIKN